MPHDSMTLRAVGAVPGAVLGAVFGLTAKARRDKPLHPAGRVGRGRVRITEPRPDLGVPLLARRGSHPCLVRWSRAVGLPAPLPDVEGFALRFEDPSADLLFASTGTGILSRYLLVPRVPGRHGAQTTLLPVATAGGPTMFAVRPLAETGEPPRQFELSVSERNREWQPVGVVEVESWGPDLPTRFDPVSNLLPGTRQYPVVRFLREPSYLMARRGATPRT